MGNKCRDVLGMILNLLVIAAIIILILTLIIDIKIKFLIILIILIVLYLLFISFEFSSPIFAFLRNKITEREFINKFGTFVQSLPTFQLKIECYHQTYRQKADYKSDYQTVVTHRENVALPYYSCRDISGLFHIGETNGKTFIKLKLIEDINFADSISYMDYEDIKNNMRERNKSRDTNMFFDEERHIPGLDESYFILIGDKESCGINMWLFLLFLL